MTDTSSRAGSLSRPLANQMIPKGRLHQEPARQPTVTPFSSPWEYPMGRDGGLGQNVSTAGVICASDPSGIVPGLAPTYSPEIFPPVTVSLMKPYWLASPYSNVTPSASLSPGEASLASLCRLW